MALDGHLTKWCLFSKPVLEALLTSFFTDPTHLQTTNALINSLTVLLPKCAYNVSALSSATPHPGYHHLLCKNLNQSRKAFFIHSVPLKSICFLGGAGESQALLYCRSAFHQQSHSPYPSSNPLGSKSKTECIQSVFVFSKQNSQRQELLLKGECGKKQ